MPRGLGKVQQKILLLLLGGLALGVTISPKRQWLIIKEIGREWRIINKRAINEAIRRLYQSKLVTTKKNHKGTLTLILTENGRKKSLTYNINKLEIKVPAKWDKEWRIVSFDIPEKLKRVRDVFRFYLKKMNFYEFQKSIFISPYECRKEIKYLVEFYNLQRHVRFMRATYIDNEFDLKNYFDLL